MMYSIQKTRMNTTKIVREDNISKLYRGIPSIGLEKRTGMLSDIWGHLIHGRICLHIYIYICWISIEAQPCKRKSISRIVGCGKGALSICWIHETIVSESPSIIRWSMWRIRQAYLMLAQAAYNSASGIEESRRGIPPAPKKPSWVSRLRRQHPPVYAEDSHQNWL